MVFQLNLNLSFLGSVNNQSSLPCTPLAASNTPALPTAASTPLVAATAQPVAVTAAQQPSQPSAQSTPSNKVFI